MSHTWWSQNTRWLVPLLLGLLLLGLAIAGAVGVSALTPLTGLTLNLLTLGALFFLTVAVFFGFLFYFLGGTRSRPTFPGQQEEVTLENDYWGHPQLSKIAAQWISFARMPAPEKWGNARLLTGILLTGPRGAGKSFLAQCMAGSAQVPLVRLDASHLAAMRCGAGAVQVARTFYQARFLSRRYRGCILLIEELADLGSQNPAFHALLAELLVLDRPRLGLRERWQRWRGKIASDEGWVLAIGATSRPEELDPSLTDARCFQVTQAIELPGYMGRKEIIQGYLSDMDADQEIDAARLAQETSGATPAYLAQLITRRAPAQALLAGRKNITDQDLQVNLENDDLGQFWGQKNDDVRRAAAYHQAGHVVAAWALTDGPIPLVSANAHPPYQDDREGWNMPLDDMVIQITILVAGRAAELQFLDRAYASSKGDFAAARTWLLALAEEGYFSTLCYRQSLTEGLMQEMDALVDRSLKRIRGVLRRHSERVEAIVAALLEKGTLEGPEIEALLGEPPAEKERDTLASQGIGAQ